MENQSNKRGRLAKLRFIMQAQGIDACIIPSSDAHQGEYIPDYWKTREYFSGFTGSAGTLVVTAHKACLWTDSRYFLQAEIELEETGILLQKEGVGETPGIEQWIVQQQQTRQQYTVGVDGSVFAISAVQAMQQAFQATGILLRTDFNPAEPIWTDRPPLPSHPIFLLPEAFSGSSASEKIESIRQRIADDHCNAILVCALDEVAWTYNIRGCDVPCNPVAVAYALITPTEAVLFISPEKINQEIQEELSQHNIRIAEYDRLPHYLDNSKQLSIRIDAHKTNFAIFEQIQQLATKGKLSYRVCKTPSPIAFQKAVKNETEIEGIRSAMQKDGVVLVKLLMWIEQSLTTRTTITETDIEEKLKELRSQQALYFGESFNAIVGYGAHGAIVHYHASEASNQAIAPQGFLLIDTGGQYFNGTTDITRTLALGEVTPQMKHDYTLVLKGHIGIASAQFPQGTRGGQLDILARQHLWREGLNYGHGTGHGVGHFLNVHEGLQNIRTTDNGIAIAAGMLTSNEPGIYREGQYGIRIENLVLAQPAQASEFGDFLRFETLTLCPIDSRPIDATLLTADEKNWLNNYHQTVYDQLAPLLSEQEQEWLKQKT